MTGRESLFSAVRQIVGKWFPFLRWRGRALQAEEDAADYRDQYRRLQQAYLDLEASYLNAIGSGMALECDAQGLRDEVADLKRRLGYPEFAR